jgi:hypothetical protein
VHFEVVKIPTVTKNGFLTKQMESVQNAHMFLNCTNIQESTGLKMKKIAKGQKSFLFRHMKKYVVSFFGQPDLES